MLSLDTEILDLLADSAACAVILQGNGLYDDPRYVTIDGLPYRSWAALVTHRLEEL